MDTIPAISGNTMSIKGLQTLKELYKDLRDLWPELQKGSTATSSPIPVTGAQSLTAQVSNGAQPTQVFSGPGQMQNSQFQAMAGRLAG